MLSLSLEAFANAVETGILGSSIRSVVHIIIKKGQSLDFINTRAGKK